MFGTFLIIILLSFIILTLLNGFKEVVETLEDIEEKLNE